MSTYTNLNEQILKALESVLSKEEFYGKLMTNKNTEPLMFDIRRIGAINDLYLLREKLRSGELSGAPSPKLETYLTSMLEKHFSEGGEVLRTWVERYLPRLSQEIQPKE